MIDEISDDSATKHIKNNVQIHTRILEFELTFYKNHIQNLTTKKPSKFNINRNECYEQFLISTRIPKSTLLYLKYNSKNVYKRAIYKFVLHPG